VTVDELRVLSAFVSGLQYDALPPAVVGHCGTLIADSVACTIGALQTSEGRAVIRALSPAAATPDPGEPAAPYQLYLSGDMLAGVYIDASLANLLDFDDVYEGSGHIGCGVVPAAFRVGARRRASGPEVVAAAAAGFEVGCRLAEALRPSESARAEVWGIGTRLAPASAAVASRLLKLPPETTAHALALACATAPVPSVRKTVYGGSGVTWVKNNMGIAAAAGVSSALLARAGAQGPLDILDGGDGFARMIGTDVWKPEVLTDGLGARWWFEQLGLKGYPCCRHAHAVIDAARSALGSLRLRPAEIEELAVAGPLWIHGAPFTDPSPAGMLNAQYSLPYCLAVALLDVEPGLAWFDAPVYRRGDVRALAAKVRIEARPSAVGRVKMTGRGQSVDVGIEAPRGSPAAPLTDEERWSKHRRLVEGLLEPAAAAGLYDTLRDLARSDDISAVAAELPPAALAEPLTVPDALRV
jgi:2-methylcitrate dehydratase PrpD